MRTRIDRAINYSLDVTIVNKSKLRIFGLLFYRKYNSNLPSFIDIFYLKIYILFCITNRVFTQNEIFPIFTYCIGAFYYSLVGIGIRWKVQKQCNFPTNIWHIWRLNCSFRNLVISKKEMVAMLHLRLWSFQRQRRTIKKGILKYQRYLKTIGCF